jgi:hypothetical protein
MGATAETRLRQYNAMAERMQRQQQELYDFSRARNSVAGRIWGPRPAAKQQPIQQQQQPRDSIAAKIYPHLPRG